MPRLSLYRPERSKDYEFLDRTIYSQFEMGGTDIFVHKYLGPANPSAGNSTADTPTYNVLSETNIQDMLFLENRDRKYDTDVYTMRCIYNMTDNDFNLSQFGLFLSNDTIYINIHINSSVKTLGRKIMSGDVIEMPHLKDEYALNDYTVALKRFYVVEDVTRPSLGFSQTWYPHLYRLKIKQIVDSQEFKDIFDQPAGDGTTNTLRDLLSTYNAESQINNAILAQAEADAPLSGYNTKHFYTLQVNSNGETELVTVDQSVIDASSGILADRVYKSPDRNGYVGYLLGDGFAPNGEVFGIGISFPTAVAEGDYYLRTDFVPNRLFRYNGVKWTKIEDAVRTTLTNTDTRNNQKGTFINNTNTSVIGGDVVQERQSLSKALRPKADN